MQQGYVMGTAAGRRKAPARSAAAARAHESGDVTWVIDLAQPVTAGANEPVDESGRYALTGLSLIAAALWTFNIAILVMHAG